MYGITARLFLRNSTSFIVNHYRFKVCRCLSVHNLRIPYLLAINNDLNNYINRRSFAALKQNRDQAFVGLGTAYNEQTGIHHAGIKNIVENSDLELLTENEHLLLLQCCGHAMADLPMKARAELCDTIWKKLEESGVSFNVNYYNTYLQICIENRVWVDFEAFLTHMRCEANQETYRLLLDSVSEVGDVKQTTKIVSVMKNKNYPADERIFNALILAHAVKGGLKDAETIFKTMQMAHIAPSNATYFCLIRGVALFNKPQELVEALQRFPHVVHEENLLKLLLILGLQGNHDWLNKILQPLRYSKLNMKQIELLCIHLIASGQPEAAMAFYVKFVEPSDTQDKNRYAFLLLVEMLRASTPPETIISMTSTLKELNLNPLGLEKVTGVALKKECTETAWKLLEAMPNLKCHYFWPLLIQTRRIQGEAGIFSTLKNMLEWNIKPDLDTLEYYSIPLCDAKDPKQLLLRLQNLGFTVTELLSPLLGFLLSEQRIVPAQMLCKTYETVPIHSERLINSLAKACKISGDIKNTVNVLRKICKTPVTRSDYAGQFLARALNVYHLSVDHQQFLELLQKMKAEELKISSTSAEHFMFRLRSPNHDSIANSKIKEALASLVGQSLNTPQSHIPHPREMNADELENHLIELQHKNMETRGILRRLIIEHAKSGNVQKVKQLREDFINAGNIETPGMKAAILKIYLANNDIDNSLNMYQEIKKSSPTFVIDDFKVLDLATALVTDNKFESAMNILLSESRDREIQARSGTVRNCWRLLGACSNEAQQEKLFNLLVDKGYCVPSNNILGPLVKVHLNKKDLQKAVAVYKHCAEKYNCTPLQVELLCMVIEEEQEELLQEVLNVSSKIHGIQNVAIALIAGLAQNGLHKSLRKFLLETEEIPKMELDRRCQRWVQENNLPALETLAQAAYRLPSHKINRSTVYQCIMKIHSINNDCEAAEAFYNQLVEKGEEIPSNITDELCRLVNRCKKAGVS